MACFFFILSRQEVIGRLFTPGFVLYGLEVETNPWPCTGISSLSTQVWFSVP